MAYTAAGESLTFSMKNRGKYLTVAPEASDTSSPPTNLKFETGETGVSDVACGYFEYNVMVIHFAMCIFPASKSIVYWYRSVAAVTKSEWSGYIFIHFWFQRQPNDTTITMGFELENTYKQK